MVLSRPLFAGLFLVCILTVRAKYSFVLVMLTATGIIS